MESGWSVDCATLKTSPRLAKPLCISIALDQDTYVLYICIYVHMWGNWCALARTKPRKKNKWRNNFFRFFYH